MKWFLLNLSWVLTIMSNLILIPMHVILTSPLILGYFPRMFGKMGPTKSELIYSHYVEMDLTHHPTRMLIILVHVTSLILWFTLMKPSWKIWWYLINLWKNYLILFPLSIVRSTWMMTCTSLFLHEMSIGWNIPTKPMIHLLKEILKKSFSWYSHQCF